MWANETDYKRDFAEALRYHDCVTQEHEDKIANFIPDLSIAGAGIDGWIEVKYCGKVPGTLDSIKHYTMGQQDWLIQRGRAGSGWCFLLVGTPELHVLWRFGSLASVRNIPFKHARAYAWDQDCSYPALAERMADRMRRRLLHGASAGGAILRR